MSSHPRVFRLGDSETADVGTVLTRDGQLALRREGMWWLGAIGLGWSCLLAGHGPVVEVPIPDYNVVVYADRDIRERLRNYINDVRGFRAAIGYPPDDRVGGGTASAIAEVRRLYRETGGQPLPDPAHRFQAHNPD